jgi:hypothetical protein
VPGAATGVVLDVISESLGQTIGVIDGNALKGMRSRLLNRTREGIRVIGGGVSFNPVTSDLAFLLKYFLGGTPAADSYPVAETLPSFVIAKKLGGTAPKALTYPVTYGNVLTLSATRGQPLTADMSVLALAEVDDVAFPTFDYTNVNFANAMLVFHDLTLTLAGTQVKVHDISFTINNALDVQMVNSRDATAIFPGDRVVTVAHSVPDADVTHSTFKDVPVVATAVFTYANQTLTLSFPAVRYTTVSPVIAGRGEIRYPLTGQAFRTSNASPEIAVTLDSEP